MEMSIHHATRESTSWTLKCSLMNVSSSSCKRKTDVESQPGNQIQVTKTRSFRKEK